MMTKKTASKISTRLNPYCAPEANSQHGFQEFLDVWLDARTHGSGKHADTSKDGGVHLHGLLSPAHRKLEVSHLILKTTVFKHYSQECGCSRTGLIF